MSSNFWDERYLKDEYVYGKNPNEYFKSKIDILKPGKILLPGEGEGRNAVYAAKNGWEVFCFDFSSQAKIKAEKLAKENNVHINYITDDVNNINYEIEFDLIAFVFNHFIISENINPYKRITNFLRKDGNLILELFSKEQIEYQKKYNSGGPKNIDVLFDFQMIYESFPNFEAIELKKELIELKEGNHHIGYSSVIDFFAKKK